MGGTVGMTATGDRLHIGHGLSFSTTTVSPQACKVRESSHQGIPSASFILENELVRGNAGTGSCWSCEGTS